MQKFYYSLSKTKKIFFLVLTILLSVPIGGFVGLMLGLFIVNFIPISCSVTGCHNAFEFHGMFGYEATGFIGFWFGLFVFPILYMVFIVYLEMNKE